MLTCSSYTSKIAEIFISINIYLYIPKLSKKKELFSNLCKFLNCFVRPHGPPWCRTQILGGTAPVTHTSHQEKENRPKFRKAESLEPDRMTKILTWPGHVVQELLQLDCIYFWILKQSRVEGENHHYRRTHLRKKGHGYSRLGTSSPASARHGTMPFLSRRSDTVMLHTGMWLNM